MAAARGLDYILARQDPRGGIPSEHYGVLRKGAAFGSLAAWILSVQAEAVRSPRRAKLDHLLRFLADATADPGKLDYANYARAYYLRALAALGEQPNEQRRIARELVRHQFSAANGWSQDDIGFGGWGLGAEIPTKPFGTDFVNLSVTTTVIEALTEASAWPGDGARNAARKFVMSCAVRSEQGATMGFVYSPMDHRFGGKAGKTSDGRPVPYAAPTADGARALLALGQRAESQPIEEARAFLAQRFDWQARPDDLKLVFSPSFPMESALRFYTIATVAETARALGQPVRLPGLVEAQRADGSWANGDQRMKEDDPVLATMLALRGLATVR